MHCPQSDEYVRRAGTDSDLETLEREAIDDIRLLQCAVEFGVPTNDLNDVRYRISNVDATFLFLKNPRTNGGRFIEGAKRVYVLSHAEWIANQQLTENPALIGRYVYAPAVILLHSIEGSSISWCKNVLIHESLHSVSLYSRIWNSFPDIISRHRSLIEGITECLTGYILLEKHPDCYNVWKTSTQGKCAIAYRELTRLFCSLAQIIGINPMANFYLSLGRNFGTPWNQFVESIRSLGFSKFNYAMNEDTAFREPLFREECVKSITGFKKIYDSQAKSLDFSQIR